MIVLDVSVVSELMRADRSPAVAAWARAESATPMHITAITLAELLHGVERMPPGRRRLASGAALTDALAGLHEPLLDFDGPAAEAYARLSVRRERAGRPNLIADAQMAAICLAHGATLATRDAGFADAGIAVVDPWAGP